LQGNEKVKTFAKLDQPAALTNTAKRSTGTVRGHQFSTKRDKKKGKSPMSRRFLQGANKHFHTLAIEWRTKKTPWVKLFKDKRIKRSTGVEGGVPCFHGKEVGPGTTVIAYGTKENASVM